ncbi:hypothetical protein L2E82_36223 [Cichorium intybus]|uniref:Uncharacterized protein n=1 Tax=Cichorium intybus TaxID=13427 RepID=A0ACB9BR27_CICIN|nr:hypothetical protein L2E82_36223 [Cichorium intybus]
MLDEIPFHIQAEIIKRLPVVSLLQFRSVSKGCKSLIDSSDFIAAHSVTQPQHLLLRYENPEETTEKYVSFVDDDTFPQQRFVHTLPQSIKLLINSTILGSSHGLLCLRGYCGVGENLFPNLETETVVLWNPSIRKSISVAVPNNINPDLDHETDLGFGVCSVTLDPKIVQITQFNKTSYHCEAKVYTVSSGKWRSLSSNLPCKPFRVLWPQVVVDRFIYWCAFDPMAKENGLPNHNLIMSFDTTNENFGEIDLPDNLRRHPPIQLCISKLRECLVMLEYDNILKRACVVWMMENGVQKSFTKLYTFEAPYWSRRTGTALGFTNSGQPIMEVVDDHGYVFEMSELVAYEPNSKRLNCLEIYGTTETFFVNSYTETLVLLGRSDCNIVIEDDEQEEMTFGVDM